jgi:hypothetical protein
MIRAEIHSDDFRQTAKFDATPWFEQATDAEILALHDIDWGGHYEADAVAQHLSDMPGYESVADVLGYCQETGEVGFECHVHAEDILVWLTANRPEFAKLFADEMPEDRSSPHWDRDSSWRGSYAVRTISPIL